MSEEVPEAWLVQEYGFENCVVQKCSMSQPFSPYSAVFNTSGNITSVVAFTKSGCFQTIQRADRRIMQAALAGSTTAISTVHRTIVIPKRSLVFQPKERDARDPQSSGDHRKVSCCAF